MSLGRIVFVCVLILFSVGCQKTTSQEKEITMIAKIDEEVLEIEWEENGSVTSLKQKVEKEDVIIEMIRYGSFEQVGDLGFSLPSQDIQMNTKAGDLVLYGSDQVVLFYGNHSWSYTKLGKVKNKSKKEMTKLLSDHNVILNLTKE